MSSEELVYKLTSLVPKGKVSTYGRVALAAGIKNPRIVGEILHRNPDPQNIPCHRVVNYEGKVAEKFAFGGAKEQIRLLRSENIEISRGAVNLEKYLWSPQPYPFAILEASLL